MTFRTERPFSVEFGVLHIVVVELSECIILVADLDRAQGWKLQSSQVWRPKWVRAFCMSNPCLRCLVNIELWANRDHEEAQKRC